MKNWSILVAVFVLIMKGFVVEARNYSFKHLNCDDGLSSNCVKALLQDSCGFMWIGTKNGLNRYDGTSILRFNCFDKEAKRGNNNISALHEDDDRNIWIGTDRGIYKYNPYKDLFSFVSLKSREGVSAEDWVQDIISDNEGNTWALVPNQGVFKYSGSELEYHSVVDNGRTRRESPISIFVASDGSIYVGTSNSGLFRYDKDLKRFRQVKLASNGNELKGHTLQFIKESEPGKLVICTDVGDIWTLDLDNMQLRELPFSNKGKVYLRSMLCIGDEVWIATQNGLYIINPTKGTEEYIKEDISNPSGLSDNAIYTLYCDANDDIWVGTSFGGVDYYQRGGLTFERYSVGGNEESLSSKRIRGLAQAPNGNILIGTEEAGINLLNPETGEVTHLTNSHRGMERITLIIKRYGDELYTGFARDGLDVISPDGKVRNISFGAQGQDNSVYAILVDSKGNEWIGLGSGLYRRDAGTNDFYEVEDISYDWIFDIYEAENGIIWIASMGNGVWKYDPTTKQMKNYPYDEDWSNGLRTNSISAIMEDSKGNIWLSTDRGGLCRYNSDKDNFIAYGIAEGLPDDVVYDVLEDDNGYLWFGTNNGIVKFNPETNEVKTFNSREGLIGNQYNYHAALKGENGYFYFGGTDGLVAFNPSLDVVQDSIAPVYFTSLKISNEIVPVGDGSPLESNIIFTDEIELSHNQSTFSLSVSSPSYDIQSSPQYSYRMRPIDNKWSPIDDSRIISFANLSSGSYVLDVKISSGTAESCRSIRINILPPWYATIWAKMLYLLFIVGAGLAWFRWYHSHKEKQLVESQNLFAIKKEKELFASKVQFFTEIAHEIRTPLTLIGSPLEAIEGLGIKDAKLQRYLKVMRKNTDRLLDLTGQLLDFQKLGASRMTLKYENVDVADLLSDTLDRFEPAISLKHKILVRNIPAESIEVSIDKEAITNKPENNVSNNDPNKNPVDNKVDNNINNDSNNSNKNNNEIENKVDENIQNPNINVSGNIIENLGTENPMQPGVTSGETYSSGEGGTATNKPVK
ncbi:MAG: hybrid sensor histidine kinase/response regulator, partial [Muribaculaceae bacterium]|nr:hybrid sensor histidine kinase/response regulator [Muribaculaceae bacterium]